MTHGSPARSVDWPHPIRLVVNDDLQRWRLTVALRWLLALPHLLVLTLWTYLAIPVAIVNWVIGVARGPPVDAAPLLGDAARPLPGARLRLRVLRRRSLSVVPGVVRHVSRRPRRRSGLRPVSVEDRASASLLVLPAYVLTTVLGYVLLVVAFLGALYALVTGRYPRGFRDLSAYCIRYQAQTLRVPPASHRPLPDARERERLPVRERNAMIDQQSRVPPDRPDRRRRSEAQPAHRFLPPAACDSAGDLARDLGHRRVHRGA